MIGRRRAIALLASPLAAQKPEDRILIRLETSFGTIDVTLDAARAPVTVANFLRYIDAGLYDGGVFHRTVKPDNQPQSPVKIEVIQGGPNPSATQEFPPIPLERTTVTGLKHVNGAISMARFAPDSASGDFFFCIGDQPELDFGGKRNPDGQGFAAFGIATAGLDVIRAIQQAPAAEQKLTPPVKIDRARRLK